MTRQICADPTCTESWAEHEAHDGRPSRDGADLCTDPTCEVSWAEHEAHGVEKP